MSDGAPATSAALAPVAGGSWEADLAACEGLLRRGSKSFWVASRALPGRVRAPTTALYAFCRLADDAVDDVEGDEARRAVDRLAARVEAVYRGAPEARAADRAFARVVAAHGLPRELPDALVDGMRWDAEGHAYDTLEDLEAYAARVAASVGVMMTTLMGVRGRDVLARAADLGVAMQLTNVARDVGEDARRGRVYLPRTWLEAEGDSPERLLAEPAARPGVRRATLRLLDRADVLYARADLGVPYLPADCRVAIRAARLVYADIGRIVRARGGDGVTARASTSGARKLWLLVRALAAPFAARRPIDAPSLDAVRFLVVSASDPPRRSAPPALVGAP